MTGLSGRRALLAEIQVNKLFSWGHQIVQTEVYGWHEYVGLAVIKAQGHALVPAHPSRQATDKQPTIKVKGLMVVFGAMLA